MDVRGRPCIAAVVAACRPVVSRLVFQGDDPALHRAFPDLSVWADPDPGQGPLGALVAALQRVGGEPVLLLACDLPFVTAALLQGVAAALEGYDWAVPVHAGRSHPLCAAYSPAVLPVADALLRQGRRSMHSLLESPGLSGCRIVPDPTWGDPDRLFFNLNTPEDLAQATRLAAEVRGR